MVLMQKLEDFLPEEATKAPPKFRESHDRRLAILELGEEVRLNLFALYSLYILSCNDSFLSPPMVDVALATLP